MNTKRSRRDGDETRHTGRKSDGPEVAFRAIKDREEDSTIGIVKERKAIPLGFQHDATCLPSSGPMPPPHRRHGPESHSIRFVFRTPRTKERSARGRLRRYPHPRGTEHPRPLSSIPRFSGIPRSQRMSVGISTPPESQSHRRLGASRGSTASARAEQAGRNREHLFALRSVPRPAAPSRTRHRALGRPQSNETPVSVNGPESRFGFRIAEHFQTQRLPSSSTTLS